MERYKSAARRACGRATVSLGLLALVLALAASEVSGYVGAQDRVSTATWLSPSFFIDEWTGGAPTNRPFVANPVSVAFDEDSQIFVLDAGNHRVAVFSSTGEFLREFGREGQGPGEFSFPRTYWREAEIVVREGRVFVLDSAPRRIHTFSADGVFLDSIAFTRRPITIAATASQLLVGVNGFDNATAREILAFTLDGDQLGARGQALVDHRVIPENLPLTTYSRYNQTRMAAQGDKIMQVYTRLPLIRTHEENRPVREVVLEESWWSGTSREEVVSAARQIVARLRSGDYPNPDEPPGSVFHDVAAIPDRNQWVLLVETNRVFVVSDGGDLLQHYFLSTRPHVTGLRDIGVSDDGALLCAADHTVASVVACYALDALQ